MTLSAMGVHGLVTGLELTGAALLGLGSVLLGQPEGVAAAMELADMAAGGAALAGLSGAATAATAAGEFIAAVDTAAVVATGVYGAEAVETAGGLLVGTGLGSMALGAGAAIPVGRAPGHPTDTDMPDALPPPGGQGPSGGNHQQQLPPSGGAAARGAS